MKKTILDLSKEELLVLVTGFTPLMKVMSGFLAPVSASNITLAGATLINHKNRSMTNLRRYRTIRNQGVVSLTVLPVESAIRKLGGRTAAAYQLDTTVSSIHGWVHKNNIPNRTKAVQLAGMTGIPLSKLHTPAKTAKVVKSTAVDTGMESNVNEVRAVTFNSEEVQAIPQSVEVNWVKTAIRNIGGVTKAARELDVPVSTLYYWSSTGNVSNVEKKQHLELLARSNNQLALEL